MFKWLLGDRLYLVSKSWVYWFVGRQIESGGALSVAAGEVSIEEQADMVQKLAAAVGHQQAAVQQISRLLETNNESVENLTRQVQLLVNEGSEDSALQLVIELEAYESMSPQLEEKLKYAKENFVNGQQSLKNQQAILHQMKIQQKTNAASAAVNAALESATREMNSVKITGSDTLKRASDAIDRRGFIAQGVSESLGSLDSTSTEIKRLEASSRLDRFKNTGK